MEDDDVCEGTVEEQGPIFARVLRNISPFGATSKKLCSIVHLCEQPPVQAYNIPFPPATGKPRRASHGRAPFKVVHISDLHVDRQYKVRVYSFKEHVRSEPYAPGRNGGTLHEAHLL